jgi:hypothetical protein
LLLGSLGNETVQLFAGCLELLDDGCIVADHLFLAGLELPDASFELLDLLLHDRKETA